MHMLRTIGLLLLIGAVLAVTRIPARAQEFEQEPILYSKSEPDNRVSQLIAEIARGHNQLAHDAEFGYLRSLLAALDVPVSSQMLVFSKTSMQRQRIAP